MPQFVQVVFIIVIQRERAKGGVRAFGGVKTDGGREDPRLETF